MLVLITGKGKTPKTEKYDGKLLKEPRLARATEVLMMMMMMIMIFVLNVFEILNKFLGTAFSLVQFNNWDTCVLAVFVLQTVRTALFGKSSQKTPLQDYRLLSRPTPFKTYSTTKLTSDTCQVSTPVIRPVQYVLVAKIKRRLMVLL